NGPGEKNNGRRLSHFQLPWPEIQSTSLHFFSARLMGWMGLWYSPLTLPYLSLNFTTWSGPPWGSCDIARWRYGCLRSAITSQPTDSGARQHD
ncbi:hypothetical protein QBC36DRAFT_192801, partial [Triangularia setosa]